MSKQVRFNDNVSQAVINTTRETERCIEDVEIYPLTEESEVAERTSDFQLIHRQQKKILHEYHINKRKRSKLDMRNDILELFWVTYEDEAWKRLIDIADNPDTTENLDTFALQAINSVNKSVVIKRWREQLLNLLPVVQQHQMVPFHDRFLNTQFKEEENIEKMKERLIERVGRSSHWLNELVQELTGPSDTELLDDDPAMSEYNFDVVSEALSELESLHPELFENLPLPEHVAQDDILPTYNELTENQMVEIVQELTGPSISELIDDDPATPEYNFDVISETLSELESLHPELFENLPFQNVAQDNILPTDNEMTDYEIIESMEQWEEAEMSSALDMPDYINLMQDEVS